MTLDYKLRLACDFPGDKPELLLTYFVPDRKKSGGACHRILGRIKRIDTYENQIVLEGGTRIDIDCILDIEGEAFTEKTDKRQPLYWVPLISLCVWSIQDFA